MATFKSHRDKDIKFYERQPGETREQYQARTPEYEREMLKDLANTPYPGRKNVQCHDDGSRRARQEEITRDYARVPNFQEDSGIVNYVIKHPIKSLIALSVFTGLVALTWGAVKEGCARDAKIESDKAQELYNNRSKDLNDLYESEDWKRGTGDKGGN